jgi:2,3-bisphosphoglycerate-independent phosphoglycerate mutase
VSDGNVHSHVDHLLALLDRAAREGVRRLRVHALTDGRDVGARTAERHLHTVEARLEALRAAGVDARIASGGGRSVTTMDRYEADWRIVERGWRAHVLGEGTQVASAHEAVRRAYADPSIDDQTLPPFVVVGDDGAPVGRIEDGDGVLLFNFRGDRAIQICRAFEEPTLGAFDRVRVPRVTFAGLMQYDGDRQIPARFVVPPPRIDDTVSARLVAAGRSSFACSETQKFGHVTYFFNGNRSERLDPALETWVEIPSDVRPFDEVPWMKAAEITDACIAALRSGRHDHVRLNYANGDMVGHTGNLAATRVAVAAVDLCLGRLVAAVREVGGVMIVTADHGNADEMWQHDKKGAVLRGSDGRPLPKPSHTLAPVPLHLVDPTGAWRLAEVPHAGIASVGATILRLLDVPVPEGWAPPLVVPAAEPDSP